MKKIALGTRKGRDLAVGDQLYGTSAGTGALTMVWEIAEITDTEFSGMGFRNCRAIVLWAAPGYTNDDDDTYRSVSISDTVDYSVEVPELFATKLAEDPR